MIPVTSASPRQHVSRMCPWLRTADPIRRDARPGGLTVRPVGAADVINLRAMLPRRPVFQERCRMCRWRRRGRHRRREWPKLAAAPVLHAVHGRGAVFVPPVTLVSSPCRTWPSHWRGSPPRAGSGRASCTDAGEADVARAKSGVDAGVGQALADRLVVLGVSTADDDDRRPLTGVGGADEAVAAVVEPARGLADGRLGPNGPPSRDVGP
jgi:hypothetical protein